MADRKSMAMVERERRKLALQYKGRHFTNMLDEMFEMQRKFAGRFCDFGGLDVAQKERWTKEYVVCIMDELSEVLGWTNFKHWKAPKYPIEETELKYELVDIWHFLMNLMLVWGMGPEDLFTMYVAKNRENHRRQKRGY